MESRPARRRDDPDSRDIELMALVVDDESSSCAYVAGLMRQHGIRSVTETDPAHAVEMAETHAFDLAVIDLRMAPIDGMELIARLRRAPWGADMYCILLTAQDDLDTKIRAIRAGFDDVIGKTVDPPELNAKLLAARRIVARQRKLDLALTELRSLANQDPLTGLFNRRYLFEELDRMLSRGKAVSLILFDLNDFKLVNDTYGHLVGDRVLRDIATVLMRETRQQDLLARYGGDEFLLVLEERDLEEANRVAERIAAQVAALSWTVEEARFSLSLAFGSASSTLLETPAVTPLMEVCDQDLYKSKYLRKKVAADFNYQYESRGDARLHPIRITPVMARRLREGKV